MKEKIYNCIIYIVLSSYYWTVSMSWWRAHSRAVVFHTLHRVQRDTIICPYLFHCATLYPLILPQLQESSVLISSFISSTHPSPPPMLPSLSLFPPPGQVPPVLTAATPPMPPATSHPHHTGPESFSLKYIVRPYFAFVKFKFPLTQTPPHLSPPPSSFTPTFLPTSTVVAALSVAAPPGLEKKTGIVSCGG